MFLRSPDECLCTCESTISFHSSSPLLPLLSKKLHWDCRRRNRPCRLRDRNGHGTAHRSLPLQEGFPWLLHFSESVRKLPYPGGFCVVRILCRRTGPIRGIGYFLLGCLLRLLLLWGGAPFLIFYFYFIITIIGEWQSFCASGSAYIIISIHRVEDDGDGSKHTPWWTNFNPHPPCGGWQGRRCQDCPVCQISIHILRVEDDWCCVVPLIMTQKFQSTSSVWRMT